MSSHLKIEHVYKTFPAKKVKGEITADFVAVDDISIQVKAGEFLVIVGPSGCGKSTLLDLLAGLTTPSRGEITIDGKTITGPGLDRGIVFQQYALFPWLTALQNIEFGLEAKGIAKAERRQTAQHFLQLVGLTDFGQHYPSELSGGMKQRVAIARSLAYNPDVLLMDEPFAALDAQTRETLQSELLRIWQQTGKTVIFITHSIDEAIYLGQRIAIMTSRPGRIKTVIDVPESLKNQQEDVRSNQEFGQLRHHIWTLLREEVDKAQALEKHSQLAVA
ncbi:ABC transporter ATP-binding protein [Acinetobacter sp. NIPH 2699]|uniref:ABC transporter ATP-binding protein n=1 Tax=Acinetobacter sp. NIPH 2699 TaxID=2923433 RepID=UPI001F4A6674|nr:ABC transporter ATP-binding protein [Acinetobacter sp. NIPH 2699]MCH7336275.1 ABC transporter ATP-binding protein [Acinetobacter sp. NIPH 2699]